ncbi:unnamed protein product [Cladocopium goreaui]|uniref:C3H1-type domain-containing protein n=1 Tax=Cladocopium goreaui TaxID=2562237 RepID=A0A9P1FK02_9DINO|nr:unnamed protein product [Cladocopium goreaui]
MDPAVPKLSVPARRCKELKGSESDTREPDSDRLSQPSVDSQPGLQKLDEEAPVEPIAVDESRLIDLCPAEQKRRGNELLSLLSEGDKAPCLPNLPPAPDFLRKSEGIYEGTVSAASWDKKEDWHTGYVAGDLRYIPAEQSTTYQQWDMTSQSNWDKSQMVHVPPQWSGSGYMMDAESLNREMVPYLLNASHRAFGPGLTANVQCLPDGYEVVLQGAAAHEVEQGREYDILQNLGHHLMQVVGDGYVGCEITRNYDAVSHRISLWRSCEGEAADSRRCWNFARNNSCARGDQCRWAHEHPQTMEIAVKVASVRCK